MSILELIGMVCYLLFGTSMTIKGVLPLRPTQQSNEDVETPLLEANTSTLRATSSMQPREPIEETNDSLQLETSQEKANSPSAMEQLKHETEIAKQTIIEAWKVVSHGYIHIRTCVVDLIKLCSSNVYGRKYES